MGDGILRHSDMTYPRSLNRKPKKSFERHEALMTSSYESSLGKLPRDQQPARQKQKALLKSFLLTRAPALSKRPRLV